ncbi:MAG TPA: hypothetical protein VM166_10670 [Gemmatimonadaceae bacterium]|nr:hypothetical protein [Gemmatimonadaceae bacterium]
MRYHRLGLFVVLACLACASASNPGRVMRDPNLLTKEEIASAHASNAYDAINALRPGFLRYRGQTTITGSDTGYPRVYLDRQAYGELSSLKNLEVGNIRSIRYYNAAEASTRFGLGNASGAIEVTTDAQP